MAYSPPLPLLHLIPALDHRPRRPGSMISGVSGTTSSTVSNPPPSSYRQRSRSSHNPLSVLAPALETPENLVPSLLQGNVLMADTDSISRMTSMSSSPQPPAKKPGFFRRMSLSSSQNKPTVHASTSSSGLSTGSRAVYGRSVSGSPAGKDVVGGPSYESMPVGQAGASAFNTRGRQNGSAGVHSGQLSDRNPPQSQARPSLNRPSSSTPIAATFTSNQSAQTRISQASPPRSRHPIHPALASPPTSPPRRMSATSPYDSVKPQVSSAGQIPLAGVITPNRIHSNGPEVNDSAAGRSRTPSAGPPASSGNPITPSQSRPTPRSSSYNRLTDHTPQREHMNIQHSNKSQPKTPLALDTRRAESSRTVPQRDPSARFSRFDDAEAINSVSLPEGAQASVYAQPKHTDLRPMVSARRSTSSGRRTPIAKVERNTNATGVAVAADHKANKITNTNLNRTPSHAHEVKAKEQLTEASAYAKAVAASMNSRETPNSPPRAVVTPLKSQVSRPLPNPPSNNTSSASPKVNMVVIASSLARTNTSPKQERKTQSNGADQARSSATLSAATPPPPTQDKRASQQPLNFDFPRSPTLPPLVDPRTDKGNKVDPVNQWTQATGSPASPTAVKPAHLPPRLSPRLSSTQSKRIASSPLASPAISPGRRTSNPHMESTMRNLRSEQYAQDRQRFKDRPRATMTFLLLQTPIQATLLSYLSINSFLSLTGASKSIRKRFTGETVGRWVMKEWGMQVDREKGRSWPNLTVWEGFLESLLHDPMTYSTYPSQWHNLLQHLCLSHTLIVLHLRQLPATAFPNPPPLPFEDDFIAAAPNLPFSNSNNSLGSQRPGSRLGSVAGSDTASLASGAKMPRQERLVEIVMPEPLAGQERQDDDGSKSFPIAQKARRRGSIGSIASAASLSFGRRRSSSINPDVGADPPPISPAAPMPSGKAALPPVSYPSAKRYGFKRHGEPMRSRKSSDSSRPGSIFSVQSTPSFSVPQRVSSVYSGRPSFAVDRSAPPVPGFPAGLPMPPLIGGGPRSSFASSDAGRSHRRSGNGSPVSGGMFSRRDLGTPPFNRTEPIFDRPIPLTIGRVPILRVFVPLSDQVQRWPSAEGAAAAVRELEKCGAMRRMKVGDLVVNTAIRQPKTTEHVLVFVPFVRHLLLPLDYTFSPTGQIPSCVNGFDVPPSYYYPFLPPPQIIYLDLAPFAKQALQSIRLAYDRRDVTVASGARLSAKRYLNVAGFEIRPEDRVAPEWQGMVSLEAEGTAEGKQDIERRLVGVGGARPIIGPWELVREKSMMGTIWLRLVKQK